MKKNSVVSTGIEGKGDYQKINFTELYIHCCLCMVKNFPFMKYKK